MKFLNKINIVFVLFFVFFTKSAFSAIFRIENDTCLSPYKVYLPEKNEWVENFRLRVTFHETAKDIIWLNQHHQAVNKAYVPTTDGFISKPVKINFPGLESHYAKFITLYLTASSHHSKFFLSAMTFELNELEWINKIHIRFKNMNDLELTINNTTTAMKKISKKEERFYQILGA